MAKLNIEPLNQRNPLWGNKKLGTSNVTIKTSGCVITALSMLCTYYKHPVTPDELNAKLIAVDGFADLNLMKWEKLHDVFPDISWDGKIDCSKTPAPLDKVDTYINKMMPVVALVDFDLAQSGLQQHFVLIIGKENNDYFINDPWTGETYYFSAKYGDPKVGICGLRLYTGNPPQEASTGTTEASDGINERVTAVELNLDKVNDELSKNTRRLDEIQRSVDVVSTDRDILEDLQGKMVELKEIVKMNSDNLASTKKELKEEFRTNVEIMDNRIKEIENPPIEGEGKKFDILLELGKLFLGKKK